MKEVSILARSIPTPPDTSVQVGLAAVGKTLDELRKEVAGYKESIGGVAGKVDEVLLRMEPPEEPQEEEDEEGPKVDVEADMARLGVCMPTATIELTPQQMAIYIRVSGEVATRILTPIVGSPKWEMIPAQIQKKVYERAFASAQRLGVIASLPPKQRIGI